MIAAAVQLTRARIDFTIVALAVYARRLELVIAAESARALARGMQGFQVSAARGLNRLASRSGPVFVDRYRVSSPSPLAGGSSVASWVGSTGSPGTR